MSNVTLGFYDLDVEPNATVEDFLLYDILLVNQFGVFYKATHCNPTIREIIGDFCYFKVDPKNSADESFRSIFLKRAKFVSFLRVPSLIQIFRIINSEKSNEIGLVLDFVPTDFLVNVYQVLSVPEALKVLITLGNVVDDLHKEAFVHYHLSIQAITMDQGNPLIFDIGIPVEGAFANQFEHPSYLTDEQLQHTDFQLDKADFLNIAMVLLSDKNLRNHILSIKNQAITSCSAIASSLSTLYEENLEITKQLQSKTLMDLAIDKASKNILFADWLQGYLLVLQFLKHPSDSLFSEAQNHLQSLNVTLENTQSDLIVAAVQFANNQGRTSDYRGILDSMGIDRVKLVTHGQVCLAYFSLQGLKSVSIDKIGALLSDSISKDLLHAEDFLIVYTDNETFVFVSGEKHLSIPSRFVLPKVTLTTFKTKQPIQIPNNKSNGNMQVLVILLLTAFISLILGFYFF